MMSRTTQTYWVNYSKEEASKEDTETFQKVGSLYVLPAAALTSAVL